MDRVDCQSLLIQDLVNLQKSEEILKTHRVDSLLYIDVLNRMNSEFNISPELHAGHYNDDKKHSHCYIVTIC